MTVRRRFSSLSGAAGGGGDGFVSYELEFRDSLTEMDSRFRGNDGQTATASVKVTCLAEMTSFPRKRESIA